MPDNPHAPTSSQGTVADVRGSTVYATGSDDPSLANLLIQQIPLYSSISIDASATGGVTDHVDSNVIDELFKKASSSAISLLQSFLSPSIKSSKSLTLLKSIYETATLYFFAHHPLPTNHHLFHANAPPLRALAWHPHRDILAVAHESYQIFIYERDIERNTWRSRVIEHRYMANITSLEWKKNCYGTLAVGCQTGACVWFLADDNATTAHFDFVPSIQQHHLTSTASSSHRGSTFIGANAYMHFFSTPGHRHISAVSWDPSPGSQTLAVASAVDNTLMMYDIMTFNHTPLKRYGKGNVMLRWSPNGEYLYVASLSGKSRLWETRNWTNIELRNPPGLWVKSACWGPDSCSLYYSMVGKEDIHVLYIPPNKSMTPGIWDMKVLTSPPKTVNSANGETVTVGGVIKEIALDTNRGCRLAVSYEHCDLVALYTVKPLTVPLPLSFDQNVELNGYVRGMDISETDGGSLAASPLTDAKPNHIAFVPSFTKGKGALLSTVWNHDKVSFVTATFD